MLFSRVVFHEPLADRRLLACLQCDLLQRLPEISPGQSALCPRCGKELWRPRNDSLNRTLALTVAAAILYGIANSVPMLSVQAAGHEAFTTVFGGALQLWRDGERIVAGVVFGAAIVAPALQILFMLAIVLGAERERTPAWVATLLRYHPVTHTWNMLEVMLLGVLVALIKIAEMATVVPGISLFALGALVFVFAAIQSSFDSHEIWERVEWADAAARHRETLPEGAEAAS